MLWAKSLHPKVVFQSPLVMLIGLTLIRGVFYLSIFPPFLAPDEAAHFEAIRLIGQENKWPTAEVYSRTPMHPQMNSTFEKFRIWTLVGLYSPVRNLGVADNLFIHYYPTQIAGSEVVADSYLMLYHLSMAPLSRIMASFDLVTQVYVLRFVSVLLAALTVTAAWFTVRTIFPDKNIFALGVCTFIVFWPMHSHVTASINSDGLAELIGAFFFLEVAQTWRQRFSLFRGATLVSLAGLGLLTKPTTFFLVPTLVAIFIIYLGQKLRWRKVIIGILIVCLLVVVWIGAVFFYENSGAGRELLPVLREGIRFPQWSDYLTSQALAHYIDSLNFAVLSFGGLFGWSNIHLPWAWVKIWAVLLLVVMVGILLFVIQNLMGISTAKLRKRVPGFLVPKPNLETRKKDELDNFQKEVLVIFLIAIIFSMMGVTMPIIVTQSPSWGIHSRYYFPAIVPLTLYFFLGVHQLAPARFHRFLWPGWLVGWVFYDTVIFLLILIPFLYS